MIKNNEAREISRNIQQFPKSLKLTLCRLPILCRHQSNKRGDHQTPNIVMFPTPPANNRCATRHIHFHERFIHSTLQAHQRLPMPVGDCFWYRINGRLETIPHLIGLFLYKGSRRHQAPALEFFRPRTLNSGTSIEPIERPIESSIVPFQVSMMITSRVSIRCSMRANNTFIAVRCQIGQS
jgi:hypothetical protein